MWKNFNRKIKTHKWMASLLKLNRKSTPENGAEIWSFVKSKLERIKYCFKCDYWRFTFGMFDWKKVRLTSTCSCSTVHNHMNKFSIDFFLSVVCEREKTNIIILIKLQQVSWVKSKPIEWKYCWDQNQNLHCCCCCLSTLCNYRIIKREMNFKQRSCGAPLMNLLR